eukprot:GDKJ01011467.1.p1 GENE.GDKJ01011467.1~~GDKJ01011467.1.p1  ORF type:complete len:386 (-),score=84.17 GDKJ01011467.1:258-1415(-)
MIGSLDPGHTSTPEEDSLGNLSENQTPPPSANVPDRHRKELFRRLGVQRDSNLSTPALPSKTPSVPVDKSEDSIEKIESDEFVMFESPIESSNKDDFRVNYLRKLSYLNVWVPNSRKPPSHQTVIIFDWDDTLLCTTYLNVRGEDTVSTNLNRQLRNIEKIGSQLVELAIEHAGRENVFIITNAMKGWVEYSAKKYIPGILGTLEKVTVISARGNYERDFPGQYHEWKVQAFLEVRRQLNSQIVTNLISLGDSTIEMDAVHVMGREFSQALVKTIKFRETPSPDELTKQLDLVQQKFGRICLNARNLKIGLERRWNGPGGEEAGDNNNQQQTSTRQDQVVQPPASTQQPSLNTINSPSTTQSKGLQASAMGNAQIHQQFMQQQQQ